MLWPKILIFKIHREASLAREQELPEVFQHYGTQSSNFRPHEFSRGLLVPGDSFIFGYRPHKQNQ